MVITIDTNKKNVEAYYNNQIMLGIITLAQAKNSFRQTMQEIEYVELILAAVGGMELVKKSTAILKDDGLILEVNGIQGDIACHSGTFKLPEVFTPDMEDPIRFDCWADAIEYLVSK